MVHSITVPGLGGHCIAALACVFLPGEMGWSLTFCALIVCASSVSVLSEKLFLRICHILVQHCQMRKFVDSLHIDFLTHSSVCMKHKICNILVH